MRVSQTSKAGQKEPPTPTAADGSEPGSLADSPAKLKTTTVEAGERLVVASLKRRSLKNKQTALCLIDVTVGNIEGPSIVLKHRLRGQLVGTKLSLSLEGRPYEAMLPEQSWAKGGKTYDGKYITANLQLHVHYRFLRGPAGDDDVEFVISELAAHPDVKALVASELGRSDTSDQLLQPNRMRGDVQFEEVYENQRGTGMSGPSSFSARALFPQERSPYSTAHGQYRVPKEYIDVPNRSWEWVWDTWRIDRSEPCDADGWQYAFNWTSPWGDSCNAKTFVRRRKWIRLRRRVEKSDGKDAEAPVAAAAAAYSTVADVAAAMGRTDYVDAQRLALARAFLEGAGAQQQLSSGDCVTLLRPLVFDSTRVELVRLIYPHHCGQIELLDMLGALSFHSHKRALAHEFGIDLHELLLHDEVSDDDDDGYSTDSRSQVDA